MVASEASHEDASLSVNPLNDTNLDLGLEGRSI